MRATPLGEAIPQLPSLQILNPRSWTAILLPALNPLLLVNESPEGKEPA